MALLALIAMFIGLPAISLASESPTTTAPASPSARPTLMIAATDPVTVAGRGFKPDERVSLTGNGRRKSILAGPRGGFTVVFREANVCNGFTAVARGSKGSRASVKFAQFSNVHCLEPRSTQSVTASSTPTPGASRSDSRAAGPPHIEAAISRRRAASYAAFGKPQAMRRGRPPAASPGIRPRFLTCALRG